MTGAVMAALVLAAALAACGTDEGGGGTNDAAVLDATGNDGATATDTGGGDDAGDTTSATDTANADDATNAEDGTSTADVDQGPTFHAVWTDVFVAQGCSGKYCHGGVWPDEDAAYADVMKSKTAVAKCTSKTMVVPGKPEQSLLWLKCDAAAVHGCGDKMPAGSPKGLPADLSKLLKDWIAAGAKR